MSTTVVVGEHGYLHLRCMSIWLGPFKAFTFESKQYYVRSLMMLFLGLNAKWVQLKDKTTSCFTVVALSKPSYSSLHNQLSIE